MGIDFVGVVIVVGLDVIEYWIGDYVGGMFVNGCWSIFVRCDVWLVVMFLFELLVVVVVVVLIVFVMVWYVLYDLVCICLDDKVLIYLGIGGVG